MRWVGFVVAAALALSFEPSAEAQGSGARAPGGGQRWLVLPVRAADAGAENRVSIEALHTEAESLRYELSVRGM
ncbi:MAG: hypothetical protein WBN60_11540, partial [Polyangiales bacterium]